MPSSLWGYEHGETVEAWSQLNGWEMARVTGFTARRQIIVSTSKESFIVEDPRDIRKWERPSTPDAIEEFLNR